MPNTQTRLVGSGFTTFNYRGQRIAWMDILQDTGQELVNPMPEPIIPIDHVHAVEIAVCRALNPGTLTASIRELWAGPVWNQLAGLAGTNDLLDVYAALSADPTEVTCQMLIKTPGGGAWRGKNYHGCTISSIDDGEQVRVGIISIAKNINIMYTHTTPFVLSAGGVFG